MDGLLALIAPNGLSQWEAWLLIATSFLTSGLTAAVGIGGGVAMLAVMAQVMPPIALIPIHGVVQIGSNGGRAIVMRPAIQRRILVIFSIGTVVGVAAASPLVVTLPTPVLQTLLAAFVLWSCWSPKLKPSAIPERGFFLVGALASFATMFVGATGPLLAAFLSPDRLQRHAVVATHAACMVVQHGVKILAFGILGFAYASWLPLVALMILSGFVGTLAGKRLLDRLPERAFALGFKLALTVLSLRLLWSAAEKSGWL